MKQKEGVEGPTQLVKKRERNQFKASGTKSRGPIPQWKKKNFQTGKKKTFAEKYGRRFEKDRAHRKQLKVQFKFGGETKKNSKKVEDKRESRRGTHWHAQQGATRSLRERKSNLLPKKREHPPSPKKRPNKDQKQDQQGKVAQLPSKKVQREKSMPWSRRKETKYNSGLGRRSENSFMVGEKIEEKTGSTLSRKTREKNLNKANPATVSKRNVLAIAGLNSKNKKRNKENKLNSTKKRDDDRPGSIQTATAEKGGGPRNEEDPHARRGFIVQGVSGGEASRKEGTERRKLTRQFAVQENTGVTSLSGGGKREGPFHQIREARWKKGQKKCNCRHKNSTSRKFLHRNGKVKGTKRGEERDKRPPSHSTPPQKERFTGRRDWVRGEKKVDFKTVLKKGGPIPKDPRLKRGVNVVKKL